MALNAGSFIPSTASVTETPSKPASPQTNLAKVPLGDLHVVGKALTRTIEVSAAKSPQQIPNANASNTEKLLTETMGVNPVTFSEWVKKTAGFGDNANSQERMDAFRKILLDRGLQLAPPANVIYNERNGVLFVRAIRSEMDVIEQVVGELNRASAQISARANPPNPVPQFNIKAKFVEVSDDDTNLIAINSDTNGSMLEVLTDPQFRAVLHALEQRDGVDLLTEQSVTTVSGRQAQIQVADIQTIVKLNPQALVPPGVAPSNLLLPEVLYSGPLLDIIPYVAEDGEKIQLTVTATVTEFVGYDPPETGDAAPVYVDGKPAKVKRPHPRTHVRTMQAAANLYDGQTVVLGRPTDEMITFDKDGKALSAPSTSKKNLLVFVTATLIDAAGNPVHNPDSPAATPQSR
jgi:type II secretory pathway component GspD/PulD (secretin)